MANTILSQPTAVSLQLTDLLLGWQSAQAPSTRSVPVSALNAYYAPLTGATFTGAVAVTAGGVNITGTSNVNGNFTVAAGAFAVTGGNSTFTGALTVNGAAIVPMRGYLSGMVLSNDGSSPNTVLDISAGGCTDHTNTVFIINAAAFTKSTGGTFVAGTGANGMGQGLTIAANTWYHVFAISFSSTPDYYFDTSLTAANKPAGTDTYRRIGSFLTDSSSHILAFSQNGDRFDLGTPVVNVNTAPGDALAHTATVTTPSGVACEAILSVSLAGGAVTSIAYVSSLAQADVASASTNFTVSAGTGGSVGIGGVRVMTDTASSIRYRLFQSGPTLVIATNGWVDARGRFA